MPQDHIKDEKKWNKAKEIVKKQYNIDESAGDKFYELVMGVYKQARGTIHKKGKGTYFNRKKDGKVRKEKLPEGKETAPKARKSLELISLSAIGELINLEKAVKKDLPPGGEWKTIKGSKVYIKDGEIIVGVQNKIKGKKKDKIPRDFSHPEYIPPVEKPKRKFKHPMPTKQQFKQWAQEGFKEANPDKSIRKWVKQPKEFTGKDGYVYMEGMFETLGGVKMIANYDEDGKMSVHEGANLLEAIGKSKILDKAKKEAEKKAVKKETKKETKKDTKSKEKVWFWHGGELLPVDKDSMNFKIYTPHLKTKASGASFVYKEQNVITDSNHRLSEGFFDIEGTDITISANKIDVKRTDDGIILVPTKDYNYTDYGDVDDWVEPTPYKKSTKTTRKSLELLPLSSLDVIAFKKSFPIPLDKKYPGGKWVTIKGKKVYIMADGEIAPETDFRKQKQGDIFGNWVDTKKVGERVRTVLPKPEEDFKISFKEANESVRKMSEGMLKDLRIESEDTLVGETVWDCWGRIPTNDRVDVKKEIEKTIADHLKHNYEVNEYLRMSLDESKIQGIIRVMEFNRTPETANRIGEAIDSFNDSKIRDEKTRNFVFSTERFLNKLKPEARELFMDFVRRDYVDKSIAQWAETSADHNRDSIALQLAAQKEFGLDDARIDHIDEYYVDQARGLLKKKEAALRSFLRVQYDLTQEWFEEQGIKEVYIFRGMVLSEDNFGYSEKFCGKNYMDYQPISSFSVELPTAISFSGETYGDYNDHEVISIIKMPVERILSTSRTGFGCLSEAEVTVLGGSNIESVVVSKSIRPDDNDYDTYEEDEDGSIWAKDPPEPPESLDQLIERAFLEFNDGNYSAEDMNAIERKVKTSHNKYELYDNVKLYTGLKYGVPEGDPKFNYKLKGEFYKYMSLMGKKWDYPGDDKEKSLNIVTIGEFIDEKGYNGNKKFNIINLGGKK